jgi:hypothetical protein
MVDRKWWIVSNGQRARSPKTSYRLQPTIYSRNAGHAPAGRILFSLFPLPAFPKMSDSRTYEDWVSVFETGTDYEADLVRDRLDDAGMTAVVLTQRDHAFNLNVGDLAAVHVMVPPGTVEEARELLEREPFSDEELDEAALSADPDAEPAHTDREEAVLDSSPNIAGEGGPIEEPGVHQTGDDEGKEADPQAKRRHREERRARHEGENRPPDADPESLARESDELREDRASDEAGRDEDGADARS